ncbi:hypothetical protein PRIC1_004587 [Phytophthora ramorum]
MTDQAPRKTVDAATTEAGPPTTSPTPVTAAAATTTVEVVDVTTDGAAWTATPARTTTDPPPIRASKRVAKRKAAPTDAEKAQKGKKKLVRSVGLPAPQPDEPTAEASTARPSTAQRVDSATKATPRQATEFDLTNFMTSFQPGLVSEARSPGRARVVASAAAPSAGVQDEMHRLRQEVESLRSQVAGVRQSLAVLTDPNDEGELPADSASAAPPPSRYPEARDQPRSRETQGRRKKSVPDEIRALIPSNRRGEEPCLRFLGGVMCSGGNRDRCGHPKRVHGWPSADIPRRLKEWAQDTYARRRGWDQEAKQGRRNGRN